MNKNIKKALLIQINGQIEMLVDQFNNWNSSTLFDIECSILNRKKITFRARNFFDIISDIKVVKNFNNIFKFLEKNEYRLLYNKENIDFSLSDIAYNYSGNDAAPSIKKSSGFRNGELRVDSFYNICIALRPKSVKK